MVCNVSPVTDTPDEPTGAEPGPDDERGGGDTDAPLRGWIDPDDRLWRHPSEVGAPRQAPPMLLNAPPRHPARGVLMTLVGVVAIAAAVASVVFLLSPASQRTIEHAAPATAADMPLATLPGTQNTVPATAQAAGHAMVKLQATTAAGTVSLVGVAVAEGGLVATAADPLTGVRQLSAVGADGVRRRAVVVARDKTSDVALVDTGQDLPVAPFADDGTLAPGSADLTLGFVSGPGSAPAVHGTPGAVTGVGGPITAGPARGMDCITSTQAAPGWAGASGQPLLDAQGAVVGLLDGPAGGATFLPANLVVGVADALRSGDKVVHGWLGISGGDAATGSGAAVESVTTGGPADHARIVPGQVIEAVDAAPVRTMAELRSRLYVLAPGSAVSLSVTRPGGGVGVVTVRLGSSS